MLIEFQESQLDMIHARIAGTMPPAVQAPTNLSPTAAELYLQRVQGTGIGVEFLNVRPEVQQFLNALIEEIDSSSSQAD